jgi:hypothetical protein
VCHHETMSYTSMDVIVYRRDVKAKKGVKVNDCLCMVEWHACLGASVTSFSEKFMIMC